MRQNKALFLITCKVVALLFSPTSVFAISKIERMLKDHPVKFSFFIFGSAIVVVLIIVCVSNIDKSIEIVLNLKKKRAKDKKRKYIKIPKGPIEKEISLPPSELIVRKKDGESKIYKLRPHMEFWIGRAADNELILDHGSVSRFHAKIRPQYEGYVLYDINSRNGTVVNSKKTDKHILKNNDEINMGSIGSETVVFKQIMDNPLEKVVSEAESLPEDIEKHIEGKEALVNYIIYAPGQPMLEEQTYAKNISKNHICIRTHRYISRTTTTAIEMQIKFPNSSSVINEVLGDVLSCKETPPKSEYEYEVDIELTELPEEEKKMIANYTKSIA